MFQKIKHEFEEGKTLLQFGSLRVFGQALGMVVPMVVAGFFSPELFASYSLAKMLVFFFASLLISSTQTPYIIFANQERLQTGRMNKTFSVQLTFLVSSIFMFVLLMLLLDKHIRMFAKIDSGDLIFVLFAFVGLATKTFLCNLFMALDERVKSSLAEFVFGFLSLILIFAFYLANRVNLHSVFSIYLISSIILVLIFIWSIDFKIILPFRLEGTYFRELFDFTKWVFFAATAVYFIDWGNNLVLRYFVSMSDIGVYNLGYQFFKGIVVLFSFLDAYFLPFVSQNIGDAVKVKEYLYSKRPRILAAGMTMILVIFFLVPYFLGMMYGETYRGCGMVFRILLIAAAIYTYNLFYMPLLNALREYKFLFVLETSHLLVNVIMSIVLIPIIGMFGAAVATVLGYICRAVVLELYFRLRIKEVILRI